MNKVEFENALMSTIVDYISDQIILKYMEACKKATVLFTGALIGYNDAVASLKQLKEEGWELTAVMSKAATEVITEERVKKDIDPKAIYVEGAPVNGRQLINESQFVIVPALTINTAAKLANCIFDNLITNMISFAMHTGKPIVAAVDGCCPDNEVRAKLGFKVTESYKAKLRSNLVDIQSFGIVLTTDKSLAKKVNKVYASSFDFPIPDSGEEPKQKQETAKPSCGCAVKQEAEESSTTLDKRVIGRIDIAKNAKYKTIYVSSDALVTVLAAEEAVKRGITIVKK